MASCRSIEAADGRVTFRKLDLGFDTPANDTLRIRAFLEDGEGSLWIGTSRGVVRRLPGGDMVEHQLAPAGQSDYVRALLQDKEGRIWVGHKFGLIAFVPESHKFVAAKLALSPERFVVRDAGRPSQARLVPLPEAPGAAYRYDATIGGKGVRDVYASADGELWFAQNNGLGHLDGGRFRVYRSTTGSPATPSTSLPRMQTGACGSEQTPMARRGSNGAGSRPTRSRNGRSAAG